MTPKVAPTSLSAVLIAKDEEKDLPEALESLKGLTDEIVVVVDAASRDRTETIARECGAKVFTRPFDDFSRQKQAALDKTSGLWILSIDADERVSEPLKREIGQVLAANPVVDGYEIPFEVRFFGRALRFGGMGSEKHLRLFRRDKARFGGDFVHEAVQVDGRVGRLKNKIIHAPYRDLSEYLAKMDPYTTRAAQRRRAEGRRFHWWDHARLPWALFERLILKLGVLDGYPGVSWAVLSAFHNWLKYAKLRELEQKEFRVQ